MTIQYEIHPGIGIARLGNHDSDYFIAAEPACEDLDAYYEPRPVAHCQRDVPRDANGDPLMKYRSEGKLLRQAARFRVFECDRDSSGKLISSRELRPNEADIEWTVHIANRKAIGKQFEDDSNLRNSGIRDEQERNVKLIIDAGAQTVSRQNSPRTLGGTFMGTQNVTLGKALVDAANRLLVLGGSGTSDAVPSTAPLTKFADNDKWYDDTADGPIGAKISLKHADGTVYQVVPALTAWVIVAPFDFAPEIDSFIRLYDVARQAWIDKKGLPPPLPLQTDFNCDVLPLLNRVRGYRWLNGEVMRAETQDRHTGWRDKLGLLADPSNPDGRRMRKALFAHLPVPGSPPQQSRQVLMPRLYSEDPYDGNGNPKPNSVLPLTPLQYAHLKNWAMDQFVNGTGAVPEFLSEALDRIALEACSGGAFYPGMEAPRIMRNAAIYDDVFALRLKAKPGTGNAPWAGPQDASDPDAPGFPGLVPGQVTEGLAVPWQADFFQCQQEQNHAWWPATRPDHVLLAQPGRAVDSLSEDMRRWDAGIKMKDDVVTSMKNMVENWNRLGIVKKQRFTPTPAQPPKPSEPAYSADAIADAGSGAMLYYYYAEDERDLSR